MKREYNVTADHAATKARELKKNVVLVDKLGIFGSETEHASNRLSEGETKQR